MGTDYSLQFSLFAFSLLLGLFLGFVYDLFRLLRVATGGNKILVFIEDIVYCLFSAIAMIILLFNLSEGQIRLFAFIGAGVGFTIYYLTAGKFTRKLFVRARDYIAPRYKLLKIKIIIAYTIKKHMLKSKIRYRKQLKNYRKGCGLAV